MKIQHNYHARSLGGLGALLGCLIAAIGCASDQEARRSETTTARERADDHRDARREHDRDGDGVRDKDRAHEAMSAREAELDENVAVKPVAIARPPAGAARSDDDRDDSDRNDEAEGNTNTAADRQLAKRIREAIVADDALSTKAKNVEILSDNGAVTLRGPVATAEEKSRVASHAQNQAGAKRVTNQIEVIR